MNCPYDNDNRVNNDGNHTNNHRNYFTNHKKRYNRHSIRLQGYDYSHPGWYFITIATNHRKMIFGKISNGKTILNQYGKIAEKWWLELPQKYSDINIDEYVVMPNHIHGVIETKTHTAA